MGEFLRFSGSREGNCTPCIAWNHGFQYVGFPSRSKPLSARRLGATLWELQPLVNSKLGKFKSKSRPNFQHHKEGNVPGVLLDDRSEAEQMMAPHRHCAGEIGGTSQSLKTSAEFIDRIRSLEKKHKLDVTLIKTLQRERDLSQRQIKKLLEEKRRDQKEIDILSSREHVQIKNAANSKKNKLEDGKKSRIQSGQLHLELSNAVKELKRERKARMLLENLCAEFAFAIKDYEQAHGDHRLILHLSEAWLSELMHLKASGARETDERKQSILDRLCPQIEAFLLAKQSQPKEVERKEACLSPSSSPVRKWTSMMSESCSRLPETEKPDTLKAKLMEARIESKKTRG